MKKNMGNIDRGLRILVALVVTILFVTNILTGIPAYILLGLSGVFVLTSLLGFCPLYTLFGFSTCPAKRA
jgi:hypothetical protein